MERMRPFAERHGLTMLQLACQWNLAHEAVECVVPTLIEEGGPATKPIEAKRAELAALPSEILLSAEEVREIRALGDNTGCMALKGATPDHEGDERPDRWPLAPGHREVARRWGIEPERDLAQAAGAAAT
jgi:Ser/Thr protein kinase RdoA (MazF antagonist)